MRQTIPPRPSLVLLGLRTDGVGRVTNLFKLLRAGTGPGEQRNAAQPLVVLAGRRPARTLFETWLVDELADSGSASRQRLITRLSECWLRDELASGASNVDAALWAPVRIRHEVEALLEELDGDFVCTSGDGREDSDGLRAGRMQAS